MVQPFDVMGVTAFGDNLNMVSIPYEGGEEASLKDLEYDYKNSEYVKSKKNSCDCDACSKRMISLERFMSNTENFDRYAKTYPQGKAECLNPTTRRQCDKPYPPINPTCASFWRNCKKPSQNIYDGANTSSSSSTPTKAQVEKAEQDKDSAVAAIEQAQCSNPKKIQNCDKDPAPDSEECHSYWRVCKKGQYPTWQKDNSEIIQDQDDSNSKKIEKDQCPYSDAIPTCGNKNAVPKTDQCVSYWQTCRPGETPTWTLVKEQEVVQDINDALAEKVTTDNGDGSTQNKYYSQCTAFASTCAADNAGAVTDTDQCRSFYDPEKWNCKPGYTPTSWKDPVTVLPKECTQYEDECALDVQGFAKNSPECRNYYEEWNCKPGANPKFKKDTVGGDGITLVTCESLKTECTPDEDKLVANTQNCHDYYDPKKLNCSGETPSFKIDCDNNPTLKQKCEGTKSTADVCLDYANQCGNSSNVDPDVKEAACAKQGNCITDQAWYWIVFGVGIFIALLLAANHFGWGKKAGAWAKQIQKRWNKGYSVVKQTDVSDQSDSERGVTEMASLKLADDDNA